MKRKYKVSNPILTWECLIEIDTEFIIEKRSQPGEPFTAMDGIKEMVEFWGWWEQRLDLNDGDYIKTFLQQLARRICYIQAEYNYNLLGVVEQFPQEEGWYPMDGSYGIKILSIDDFELEERDFDVDELPADQEAAAV